MKWIVVWLGMGIIVTYIKVLQLRKYGFDRKLNSLSNLSSFGVGVIIWPLMIVLLYQERRRFLDVMGRIPNRKRPEKYRDM